MSALDDFYTFTNGETSGAVFLFSPWPTPDLRPHGWNLVEYQPLMLRPAGGTAPSSPPGLRIEEVRDEEGLRAFEIAIVRGFPIQELKGRRREQHLAQVFSLTTGSGCGSGGRGIAGQRCGNLRRSGNQQR